MSDPNTLRILEIDGGGERGYLSLQFLKKFVQLWGVNPSELWKHFDVICGTSVGGIMSLALALGLSLEEMTPFFTVQGPYIFSLTSLSPSVRPNNAAKVALILTDTPFYQSSAPFADAYGSGLLYKTVQTTFGANTLQNVKTNVIIPSYEEDTSTYVLFSNLNYPEFIGQNELASNVGLATGAAPIYLPPLLMNGHTYIDGGIYQNNPSQFGLNLAKMVKPTATRACLLSLGTGLGTIGFAPDPPPPFASNKVMDPRVNPEMLAFLEANPNAFNSIATIFGLFDIASVGGQESISKALSLESKYTLDQLYYYRFQPILDPSLDTELDNTDPSILAYYDTTATNHFNTDIQAISNFIGHLTA